MPLTEEQTALLDRTLHDLGDPSLPCIDLDAITQVLSAVREHVATGKSLGTELRLLRDDYLARIGGMVKAMAAVDRRRDRHSEALAYLDDLSHLPASQLIDQFRRVAARFRDTFPVNAGQVLTGGSIKT